MREGVLNRPGTRWSMLGARGSRLAVGIVLALGGTSGCSTVEPGGDPQIAQVVYDDDFFYCEVQPKVLVTQSCSGGDPTKDMSGGCHSSATPFRVLPLDVGDMVA